MALIKYTGADNVVVSIDGERKLIKPNKIFSGPEHFSKYEGFSIIGLSKDEKEKTGIRVDKSIKLEIKEYFDPIFDVDYLEESGIPRVSICIVTKDSPLIIRKCLESIRKYVDYPDYEVLLCDTGTTTEEVFDVYDEFKESLPMTVHMGHKYNFSKNNNYLAEQSTGDVVLFMNNDVFLTYDAISEMVKYQLCSNMGCVGHRLVWEDNQQEIQHDGQVLFDKNGNWHGPGHHNYHRNLNDVSDENVRVEGVTAAFLMMRKTVFEKVGGFDEDYKDIYQDVDLNLKVRKAGYENFCIRKKPLIHIDHGSRKGDQTPDSPKDAVKFHTDWIVKGPFPVRKYNKFSIGVCATNKIQLQTLKDSIKTRENYEIVFVNNKNNYLWASEALNILTEVTEGSYIFWMHQDVTFDAYEPFAFVENISKQIGGNFGILGPAGIQVGGKGSIRGVDFSSIKYNFDYLRVQTLDEFCLIGNRKNKLKFGEYLDHFHFYGADICCRASEQKLDNFVIKIPITHHSGGDINLKKKGGYESYQKQGRKFFKYWKEKFPYISTTTVHYRNEQAFWYLGKMLGLEPSREQIDFNSIDESPNVKMFLKNEVKRYLNTKPEGVTVVILNKDKPELIKKCVNLLCEHTQQQNYEILIGDTGTTDEEVLDFYSHLPDKVRKYDAGEYQFSKNNNVVTEYAKYNKVLFLNNDVFVESDILQGMGKLIEKKTAIVGLKLLYEDETIQHGGVEMVISKERNPNEYYLPEHMYHKEKNADRSNEFVDCVTGACLMMPTELFREYNGFDEQFEKVFQDIDLCLKYKKEGYGIICCNEHKAIHLESASRDPEINQHDYYLMTERWGSVKY